MLKNVENFTYNGVNMASMLSDESDIYNDYFIVNSVYGRGVLDVENNLITALGMDGAYATRPRTPVRLLDVNITLKAKSSEMLRKKIELLNEILYTEKDVPIVFDDEPDRVYYGRFNGLENEYESSRIYQAKIQFICGDPFKYGIEKEVNFESDSAIVENKGTAETEPIFELTAKEPTTFAMVSNGDEYMMVGRPVDVDELAQPRFTTILNDNCSSLVGWSALPNGAQLDTGIVGGTMHVHGGYGFSAQTYGTNPNGWVGPAIRRSLSETLQDFRVEIRILANNTSGDVGSLELHLLDENDNVIAIMAMRDSTARTAENRAVIQLGEAGSRRKIVDYNGGYRATWNDFSGIIRLEREGSEFRAYVAMLDGDRHIRRHTAPVYYDTLGQYQGKLASIIVYDAKAKEYSTYLKVMNHITVQRINQDVEVPYISDTGDVIEFNHQTGDCYINGEPVPFDFGADFFTLKKGFNSLVVLPENTFDTKIKFREKFR